MIILNARIDMQPAYYSAAEEVAQSIHQCRISKNVCNLRDEWSAIFRCNLSLFFPLEFCITRFCSVRLDSQ